MPIIFNVTIVSDTDCYTVSNPPFNIVLLLSK
nr:MAG TPA: hypothetical protein [Bacteriophage sp.]